MNKSACLLIVDDNPDQRRQLVAILQETCRILEASTGAEALGLLQTHSAPDLILIDLQFSDRNGHDLCRRIKADALTRDLPILLITQALAEEEERLGLALGAADYLIRPLSAPTVLTRVTNHLKLASLNREFQAIARNSRQQLVEESRARSQAEQTRQRIQDGKNALLHLLGTALKPLTLHEQLDAALESLQALPWLSIQASGAIFLCDTDGSLFRMAETGSDTRDLLSCASVRPVPCLCDQALANRQVIYSRHSACPSGQTGSGQPGLGHYVLPLLENHQILGIMHCFRAAEDEPGDDELDFMEEWAHVLGEILSRRLLESRLVVSRYELEKNQRAIINKLVTAAELRDNETGLHILRMSHIASILAAHVGMPPEEREVLLATSPMHDVGKIGISDTILLKQGKLSADEFAIMKAHTTIGGQILSGNAPLLSMARMIAQSHHEKWDGSGYPLGLRGEAIPLVGRICAIADVFDALTSERPYKSAWSVEQAVALIREQSGIHFDPRLVEAFVACLPEILHIKELYGSTSQNRDGSGFITSLPLSALDSPLWDDRLLIGVPMIDEQHRYLFKLLHHLEQSLQERFAILDVCRALTELENYIEYHFSNEESFMQHHRHVDFAAHQARHRSFMSRINQLWTTERENTYLAGAKLVAFLKEWLTQHVMREDVFLRALIHPASPGQPST